MNWVYFFMWYAWGIAMWQVLDNPGFMGAGVAIGLIWARRSKK